MVIVGAGAILLHSASTEEKYTPPVEVIPQPVASLVSNPNKTVHPKGKEPSAPHPSAGAVKMHPPASTASKSMQDGVITKEICPDFHIGLVPNRTKRPVYIVDIFGNAPPNSIIALYKNDRLCDTVPCKGDQFFFPRIGLDRNRNILQAKLITPEGGWCYSNTLELVVDMAASRVMEKGLDINRGNMDQARICLSFDSGENADAAPVILGILKEKHIRTTIFLTGEFIRRNPKIVRRIVEEGHEVANHTDTHPHLTRIENRRSTTCLPGVNREFLHRELKRAEEAFYHLTGRHMSPYWRAPYGETNLEIRKWAEELGYVHVSWTCGRDWEDGLDSLDWVADTSSGRYHTAEEIRNQIVNFGQGTQSGANGGIVLMHFSTYRPHQDKVYLQLPGIIDGLRHKGYEIVTVSQLLPGTAASQGVAKKSRGHHVKDESFNKAIQGISSRE